MADGVIFSATGQSPPANTNIWTDEVAIGASTAHAQIVKLANPTLDSTVMLGMTSGGLNVAIVNTALAIAALSTTSKIVAESTGVFPVNDNGASLTIDGNATVTVSSLPNLSTGSIIRIDTVAALPQSSVTISTGGAGGSTANPLYVLPVANSTATSTWSNLKLTSTAATALISSAASTRFNIELITAMNKGATLTILSLWSGSTSGTLLWQGPLSTAGGGLVLNPATPYGSLTTGAALTAEIVPASTVYLHAKFNRSS